jgi:hypothetical protein
MRNGGGKSFTNGHVEKLLHDLIAYDALAGA